MFSDGTQGVLTATYGSQNTNSWDPEVLSRGPVGEGEILAGKNLVDAAKAVGVKFFIWRYACFSSEH